VLFKMDGDGNGKEIQLSDLGQNTPLRFHNFTHDMFRQMCILSGCDYLASITGLGVKKAHGLLNKYRTMDRVFRFLKNDRSFIVPPEYEEAFERAERTFLHQSVYDHINQRVRHLYLLPTFYYVLPLL
jgi:exonuclease-1